MNFEVRLAQSFIERCHASHLVYRKYRQSNFAPVHSSGMLSSILDVLPSSQCWVAVQEGRVIGTMSTVIHSTAGLPCGLTYERDLKRLGIDGRIIAEFTKLAVDEESEGSSLVAIMLMARMIAASLQQHIDDLICVVHPRHAKVWSHIFGWRYRGDVKQHATVNNPGVLMHLDIKRIASGVLEMPERGMRYIEESLELWAGGQRAPLSGSEILAYLLQRARTFTHSPLSQRISFERHYPWADSVMRRLMKTGLLSAERRVLPQKPEREPPYLYTTRHLNSSSSNTLDRIFVSQHPLALVIDTFAERGAAIAEVLTQRSIEVIYEPDVSYDELIEAEIYDLIFINQEVSSLQVVALTDKIRKRDRELHAHTLIINVQEILDLITLHSFPQALLGMYQRDLQALDVVARILNELALTATSEDEQPRAYSIGA
jgi:hypothetical protein